MRTISVKLPAVLHAKLTATARRRKITQSALAREALEAYLAGKNGKAFSCLDLVGDLAGSVDSGIGDLASNPKHMEGFGR